MLMLLNIIAINVESRVLFFFKDMQILADLCQYRWATPLQSRPACSQLSLDRCPPGRTPTGRKHRENKHWESWRNGSWGLLCGAHPAGHDHGERLDEALDGHQFVEPEHLAGTDVQASLWHHTWGSGGQHRLRHVLSSSATSLMWLMLNKVRKCMTPTQNRNHHSKNIKRACEGQWCYAPIRAVKLKQRTKGF